MKNVTHYVTNALASITSNTEIEVEIICVDDGSTDNTWSTVKELNDPRIILTSNDGKGISDAFNTGLRKASGEYIFRCDADDVFVNNRIVKQVHWLDRRQDVSVVCGYNGFLGESGKLLVATTPNGDERSIRDELICGQIKISSCNCAYRTHELIKIRGCRNFFETGEDDDLMFRLADHYDIWYSPLHVYNARIRSTSITRTQSLDRLEWFVSKAHEFRIERRYSGMDSLERGLIPEVPKSFATETIRTANDFTDLMLMSSAWKELDRGNWKFALINFLKIVLNPKSWHRLRIDHLQFPFVLTKRIFQNIKLR